MGYYRGDYYRGDPGVLGGLLQRYGISGAEAGRLPTGIAGKEDILRHMPGVGKRAEAPAPEESPGGHVRRRMNPLNARALRRSMRRVQAFAKFASRTMSFTKRHKLKKHRRR